MILEVCVDDAAGLDRAIAGGANRIELCQALDSGGLTPSPGFMAHAASAPVPVIALIRPRSGGFVYSRAELAIIAADIAAAADAGLSGVAIGLCRTDGQIDAEALAQLILHARQAFALRAPSLTLHRAADLAPDAQTLVATAQALGFARILSSGGAMQAADGVSRLAAMVAQAAGRIAVMAGSGITPDNAASIVRDTGVQELHASARMPAATDPAAQALGFTRAAETDEQRVADLAKVCRALADENTKR